MCDDFYLFFFCSVNGWLRNELVVDERLLAEYSGYVKSWEDPKGRSILSNWYAMRRSSRTARFWRFFVVPAHTRETLRGLLLSRRVRRGHSLKRLVFFLPHFFVLFWDIGVCVWLAAAAAAASLHLCSTSTDSYIWLIQRPFRFSAKASLAQPPSFATRSVLRHTFTPFGRVNP